MTPWNVGFADACANEATNSIGGYCGAGIKMVNGVGEVGRSLAEIGAPATTFLVAESHNANSNVGGPSGTGVFHPLNPEGNPGWMTAAQNFVPTTPGGANEIITPRHFDGWNYLYVDGHVKFLKPQQTLGKNPVTGAPQTDLSQPRGGWTVYDGDD